MHIYSNAVKYDVYHWKEDFEQINEPLIKKFENSTKKIDVLNFKDLDLYLDLYQNLFLNKNIKIKTQFEPLFNEVIVYLDNLKLKTS